MASCSEIFRSDQDDTISSVKHPAHGVDTKSKFEDVQSFIAHLKHRTSGYKPEIHKDKRHAIIIGVTGSGKSTLTNWLAGCKLKVIDRNEAIRRKLDPSSLVVVPKSEGGPCDEVTPIGRIHNRSETKVLKPVDVGDMVVWDAPGFLDTDGPEENIVNAVNLYRLLCGAQSGGFVLVLLLDAPGLGVLKGRLLIDTVKVLLQLFGNKRDKLEAHLSEILFFVSKVPENTPLEIIQEWVMDAAKECDGLNLTERTNNVVIFDPVGNHPDHLSKERLVELIKGVRPIKAEEDLFSIFLNDGDRMFLEKMIETIIQKFRCSLEVGDFKQVMDDFAIVPIMTIIPDWEIQSSMKRISGSVVDCIRIWFQQIQVLKSNYSTIHRAEIKLLLDKLESSKVLQPYLEDVDLDLMFTKACDDVKSTEFKYQEDQDQRFSAAFYENLHALKTAFETCRNSEPSTFERIFGFEKVDFQVNYGTRIGKFRFFQTTMEVVTMHNLFKKADLELQSRKLKLRFIFGDQSDLKARISKMNQMVEDYLNQAIYNHLNKKFTECLVSLNQNLTSLNSIQISSLCEKVLEIKDIPVLSSYGFNSALCSDIHICLRNIERFCAEHLDTEVKNFNVACSRISSSSCRFFAENCENKRKEALISFENKILLSEKALDIVKGSFQLEAEFAKSCSHLESDWLRTKSMTHNPEVVSVVNRIEDLENRIFVRLRADAQKQVNESSVKLMQESQSSLHKIESEASLIIAQSPEMLVSKCLRIDTLAFMREFGFNEELCTQICNLVVSLQEHSAEQYKALEAHLNQMFSRIHSQACLRFAEKVAAARQKLRLALKQEIVMSAKAVLISENKFSVQEQLNLKVSSTERDWSKVRSMASTMSDVNEVFRRIDGDEASFCAEIKEEAARWVEEMKRVQQEKKRMGLANQIKELIEKGEILRDCDELVTALNELRRCCLDKSDVYDDSVKSLKAHLSSLQSSDQINLFLKTENYNGLIARYSMLNTLAGSLQSHLKLDVEAIRNAARKKCDEVVEKAKIEIKLDVCHPRFLSLRALRSCYGILTTVESTFKLEKLRDDLLNAVWSTVERQVIRVGAEVKKTRELSRDSLEVIAKLLIKGYGMSSELSIQHKFASFVREQLLNQLDSREKYEVGSSLMQFTNANADGVLFADEAATSSDASELARAILQTFHEFQIFGIELFNAKTGMITFDDAYARLLCVPPSSKPKQNIRDAISAYNKIYSCQVNLIVKDLSMFEKDHSPKNLKKITELSGSLKPKANRLSEECEKVGELLALICAEWSFLSAKNNPNGLERKYVLQPHCVQILGILRLIGMDENNLSNHLIQINTGEGKSIAIGFTAILLAKLGFTVDVVCYSSYLSLRDFKQFEELFKLLKEDRNISYSDFSSLASCIMGRDGIFPPSREIILAYLRGEKFPEKLVTDRPAVLLLDEVDVFFSDSFFGQTYNPTVDLEDEESFSILEYVWKHRASLVDSKTAVENVLQQRQSTFLLQKYKRLEPFLRIEIKRMLQDLKTFTRTSNPEIRNINPSAVILMKTQEIGYVDSVTGLPTTNLRYGYETAFCYFLLVEQNIFGHAAKANQRISIPCGRFLFSEIPKNYKYCLGMTGTLDSLTIGQTALLESYKFLRKSFLPSTFNKLKIDERETLVVDGIGAKAWDDYFKKILEEVVQELKRGRAILIVFPNYAELEKFAKAIKTTYPKDVAEYKPPQELTDKLTVSERDAVIARAIRKYMITLMTRSYGRGTDFVCRDQGLVSNGGVHIIITFFPEHQSENKQILGRTCRQDDPGSARKILFLEDLAYLGASERGQMERGICWDEYLSELRDAKESEIMERMQQEEEKMRESHNLTIRGCDAVRNGRLADAGSCFVQIAEQFRQ